MMKEKLEKFLKEKCIYIKETEENKEKWIYGYSNGLVSFSIDRKQYVTFEKEEATQLLQAYGYRQYASKIESKEEKIKTALEKYKELEKDTKLMNLIMDLQSTPEVKQRIKKKI